MSGCMIYRTKEYVERIGSGDCLSVVFGGYSLSVPSVTKVKVGDMVCPLTMNRNELYAMGRLTVEKTEPAFDHLMRETGMPYDRMFPDDHAVRNI